MLVTTDDAKAFYNADLKESLERDFRGQSVAIVRETRDHYVKSTVIADLEYRTTVLDGTNRLQSLLFGSTANSPVHPQCCRDTRIVEQAPR